MWFCEFIRRYWGSESGDFLIHDNFQKLSTVLLVSLVSMCGRFQSPVFINRLVHRVIQGFIVSGHDSLITFVEVMNGRGFGALLLMVIIILILLCLFFFLKVLYSHLLVRESF